MDAPFVFAQVFDDFLVIGHAGGDPVGACENTLEATRLALAPNGGANAIEIDLSISKDQVVFLWHDPVPMSIQAASRRFVAINLVCSSAECVSVCVYSLARLENRREIGSYCTFMKTHTHTSLTPQQSSFISIRLGAQEHLEL